jgi:phosphatidylserine/phosphatidylglycerophosphate/cardiolipin synthase-like enzyme/MFS family permease
METTESKESRWKILLTGLAGFLLAALVGVLAGLVFFRLGIYQFLIRLVPEDQPLVRVLSALLLGFVGMGLAGAAFGTMVGVTLQRIDPQGSRRRYLLGGAFAYGITYGILLIPILFLISLIGQYNQGSSKDPASFITLFGLIGLIYGLLSGLMLALVTVKLRYGWLLLISSTLAGLLGGMVLGLVLWRHNFFLGLPSRRLQLIVFFLYFALTFAGLVGGVLALTIDWVRRKREARPDRKVEPRRAQDVVTIAAGLLLFVLVFNLTNTLIEFVTMHTGTTTTSIPSETQGVGWSDPFKVSENVHPSGDGASPDLEAGQDGRLAAVWTFNQDGNAEVAYAYQTGTESNGAPVWSVPVNVSNSTTVSRHPQMAIGPDGRVHIVWSEQVSPGQWEIRYSSCYGNSCNPARPLSLAAAESCQPTPKQQDWPAIAVTQDGIVGIAWNATGLIAYTISRPGETPTASTGTCFEPLQGPDLELQPRLAAAEASQFSLVYGTGSLTTSSPIHLLEIGPDGKGSDIEIGQGRSPEIDRGPEGIQLAWCSPEGYLNTSSYTSADAPVETISSPPCVNRPDILQDMQGNMHLVWYSDQIQDNFGNAKPGNFLYESIRLNGEWSPPAAFAELSQPVSPAAASLPTGGLSALWMDTAESVPALFMADQPLYQCSADALNNTGRAVLDVVQGGQYHPAGYQSPFCGNQFTSFVYMPEPNPAFSDLPATKNGGFDLLRKYIKQARYELLISNMQWDADQDELSPGYQVIEGVADLYKQVHADPSAYPRGLTVRILLGNYPNLSTLQYGDQIWNVIDDLRKAGVEKMEDPEVGWKLEVSNFKGSYPHSHTKFIVIDGQELMAAGFNVSWLHYPADHPSGKGDSLTDMGMDVEGPVAQPGMAAFDDEWNGSSQLFCSDLAIGEKADTWKNSCEWKTGTVSHVPEVLKYRPAEENSNAFALYRTDVYKEADHAYDAALASAQESIDAIHVNFSGDMICLINLVAPDTCTFDQNALPWMKSLVEAVEKNHIKVRVIVENANSNGLENRVGIDMLQKKLASLGLSDLVEVRFFDGRVHMKTALIDQQLLFVGSQNFHYSSFADAGLLEFVAATDSKTAIQEYQKMFEYYWSQSIPAAEAVWGTTD